MEVESDLSYSKFTSIYAKQTGISYHQALVSQQCKELYSQYKDQHREMLGRAPKIQHKKKEKMQAKSDWDLHREYQQQQYQQYQPQENYPPQNFQMKKKKKSKVPDHPQFYPYPPPQYYQQAPKKRKKKPLPPISDSSDEETSSSEDYSE